MTLPAKTSGRNTESLPFEAYRADFPVLAQEIEGVPLVFLDSAASSQVPNAVIDAIADYQGHDHANVHRGIHTLSHRATDLYESARDAVQEFIGAASRREVVFTRGTTDAINLVAQSFCRPKLGAGDKVLITHLEHHSNIVPWQLVCEQTDSELIVAPIDQAGQIDTQQLIDRMDDHVRILAIAGSLALGCIELS